MEELIPVVKDKINSLIKKPNMSEKLLMKPPFRFLHDTITAIIQTTGFAEGLYTAEEMDSANINEKSAKITYLDKIFGVVGICHGAQLEVKSAKVVAGLEPENTAEFLILLGTYAANPNCDSRTAVRRYLDGGQPGDAPPAIRGVAESKDSDRRDPGPKSSSRKDDSDDVKGSIDVAKHMDQLDGPPAERGKSRSGTRGGPRQQPTSHTAISGVSERPSNMDVEIDKCDGSFELTKELLGALITKPKLTEKLLSKPPFRFLHDILMEVVKTTNFGDGLYTPEEMDSANVKEKDQKILFLEKMLRLVGVQLNTIVEAKPPKIVAGLEPQDTNRFLQLLALAAKMMPDSREAVKTTYEQLGLGIPTFTSSSGSGSGGGGGGSAMNSSSSASHKDDDDGKRSHEPAAPPQRSSSGRQQQQQPAVAEELPPNSRGMNSFSGLDDNRGGGGGGGGSNGGGGGMDDKPMEDASDAMDRDGDEAKKSMRPTTARRRPPKVKDATREITAKDTAPSMKKTEGIMKDGQNDDDDDAEIVEDERLADDKGGESDRNQGQSKLVQDILSRQAEQEAVAASKLNTQLKQQEDEKNDEKSSGIRLGRLRKTGASDKKGATTTGGNDIERLRKAVQVLVQHTGPLGTCMDYIQEDIGIMTVELHRWEEECRKYENEVEHQKHTTETTLLPLQRELADLEDQIQEQKLKVSVTKASIAKNENRIQQILRLTATA